MATRRTWFVWHSWIGLTGGLLLFVICWSGAVAVFSYDLDRLLDPRLSAPPAETVAWQAIHDQARSRFPAWTISQINGPAVPGEAAESWAEDEEGVLRRIYSDPVTGEVLGASSYFNIQRFFRSLHMSLMIGELPVWGIPLGYLIVGLFSFPLLASGITSLLFYSRFWRGFFRLSARKGTKVMWSDIHKLTGLWSLWFLLVIALTGIWYLVEWKSPEGAAAPGPPPAVSAPVLPLDELVGAAQRSYPGLRIKVVSVYDLENGVLEVQGQDGSWLVRDRGARAWVNARDGSMLAVQRPGELSLYERWIETADPLHFGDFGGLPVKAVWFLFGVALSGLCLTGAYLQAKRQQRRSQRGYRATILVAYAATSAILILAAAYGTREVLTYGSNGDLPEIGVAQFTFIATWVVSTLAALATWVRYVR